MQVMTSAISDIAVDTDQAIRWWYFNLLIDAPDTPLHEHLLVLAFTKFRSAVEQGRFLLISPTAGTLANFSTPSVREGAMSWSCDDVEVNIGDSTIRGGYPGYEVHATGMCEGAEYRIDLSYTADLEPERLTHFDGQLKHFVVYRMLGRGTVVIGDKTWPVTGIGFYEHLYGDLGWERLEGVAGARPRFAKGWDWYSSPKLGDGLAFEFWAFIAEDEPQPAPFVSVALPSGEFVHFDQVSVAAERQGNADGIEYSSGLRVRASGADRHLDVVITRRGSDNAMTTPPHLRNRALFLTGFADITGAATIAGVVHQLNGPIVGSAYRRTESAPAN